MDEFSLAGTPWMPMPDALVPIQRVPSGLLGPGGAGVAFFAQSELGGSHLGFLVIWIIKYVPVGVG